MDNKIIFLFLVTLLVVIVLYLLFKISNLETFFLKESSLKKPKYLNSSLEETISQSESSSEHSDPRLNFSKIYILYTGGTIGMLHDEKKGLIPVKGNLDKLIKEIQINQKMNIEYTLDKMPKLIDSSNLRSSNWKQILQKLIENHDKYDSFIVIHGTDTLAYTASALSFFLRDWSKTVIVTGSQIPMFEFRNDAENNLINSLILSLYKIPEVLIVFGGGVYQGNRSSKQSSTDFEAYKSPNYEKIGNIDVGIKINHQLLKNLYQLDSNLPIKLPSIPSDWNISNWSDKPINILEMTLLPTNNTPLIKSMIDMDPTPNAIILRTYGIGNAPVSDTKFMHQLKRAHKYGILVVNCTQCTHGGVDMDFYDTGVQLKKVGVVSGSDMTPEAIFGKLFYLFQILGPHNIAAIRKLIKHNIAGELTGFVKKEPDIKQRDRVKKFFKKFQEL